MLTRLGRTVPSSAQKVLARRLQWAEDTLARNFPVVWADIASDPRTSHPDTGEDPQSASPENWRDVPARGSMRGGTLMRRSIESLLLAGAILLAGFLVAACGQSGGGPIASFSPSRSASISVPSRSASISRAQPRRIGQRPAISSSERCRTRRECASERFCQRGQRIQLLSYLALDRHRSTGPHRPDSGDRPGLPPPLRGRGRMAGQGRRGVRGKRGAVRLDARRRDTGRAGGLGRRRSMV